PGTPLEGAEEVDPLDLARMIAVARIAMPRAKIRLSAGRTRMTDEAQALCFFAGANSIFYGEKLLTAENPGVAKDRALLAKLGLSTLAPDPSMAAPQPDEARACVPDFGELAESAACSC